MDLGSHMKLFNNKNAHIGKWWGLSRPNICFIILTWNSYHCGTGILSYGGRFGYGLTLSYFTLSLVLSNNGGGLWLLEFCVIGIGIWTSKLSGNSIKMAAISLIQVAHMIILRSCSLYPGILVRFRNTISNTWSFHPCTYARLVAMS